MSSAEPTYTVQARYLFPLSGPPVEDGRLAWQGEVICALSRARSSSLSSEGSSSSSGGKDFAETAGSGPKTPTTSSPENSKTASPKGAHSKTTSPKNPATKSASPKNSGVEQAEHSGESSLADWSSRDSAEAETLLSQLTEDLGPVAILPGLINAHTHLEFSDLEKPLATGDSFVHWIRELVAFRDRPRDGGETSVAMGLAQSLRQGVACLGEIAQEGWTPEPFAHNPLEAIVFLEVLGLKQEGVAERLEIAEKHLRRRKHRAHWTPGLSPHAPYSVHPELLQGLVKLAREYSCPLAMHLAESQEELELLQRGRGPLRTLLEDFGVWDSQLFPGDIRPLDYLKILSQAPLSLVIHGNYLDEEDVAFLAEQRDRMSAVYCPRTHGFFGHPEHPLPRLLDSGARVAIGTDSRASNPDLSLLAELQYVARQFPELSGETILRLGTLSAAEALGRSDQLGDLQVGKRATFTVVALPPYDARDPYELLWDENCHVLGSVVDGQWVHREDF